jgi:hypothetical protein
MSDKHPEGSNVLAFKRVEKQAPQVETIVPELKELLAVYDQLIALLRETDDDSLDSLADSFVAYVVRCREVLASGVEEQTGQALLKDMRSGLREFPSILRTLLPGLGPRLGESMQHKLGVQFSSY